MSAALLLFISLQEFVLSVLIIPLHEFVLSVPIIPVHEFVLFVADNTSPRVCTVC